MTFVMPIYLRTLELRHRLSKYRAMTMLSHRQGWSLFVLVLFLSCRAVAADPSDSSGRTYHTGTSEVRVTFFATDERNRAVERVTSDDFAVVDNDLVVRDFRSLARAGETNLSISLLVDTSESVAAEFGETRRGLLRLLSEQTGSTHDGLSLITFSGLHPTLLCSGDCRTPLAEQKILALKPGGPTPLFDTMSYAARFIARHHTAGTREVLILFSDGNDTVSMASARGALEAVVAAGAILYTIEPGKRHGHQSNPVLEEMAAATGGRSFFLQQDTVTTIDRVFSDLRSSYIVTYKLPSRLVGFHSLRILPKHNLGLQFHCRRGYYYDEAR